MSVLRAGNPLHRLGLQGVLLALVGLGCLLLAWDAMSAPYADAAKAERLILDACDSNSRVRPLFGEQLDSLRTTKYALMDAGAALALAAGTCWAFARRLSISRLSHVRRAVTPAHPSHFLIMGLGAIAWAWLASCYGYVLGLERDYYPWCADSLGIPLIGTTVFFALSAVVASAAALVVMRWFGQLPAPLRQWDRDRPSFSWALSIVTAMLVGLLLVIAITAAQSEFFGLIPACVVAAYLLLSTRAALLHQQQADSQRP